MALAQETSGGAPGSQEFLSALQNATTHLWSQVSMEEQKRYAEIARNWSENAPPKVIQAKSVFSHHSLHHFTNSASQNGFSGYPRANSPGLPNTTV